MSEEFIGSLLLAFMCIFFTLVVSKGTTADALKRCHESGVVTIEKCHEVNSFMLLDLRK